MPGQLTLDTKSFSKWVAAEIRFSRKDAADVLNKAAGNVAANAVKFVKKADAAKLDQKFKVAGSQMGKLLKNGTRSKSKNTRHQVFKASRLVYGILRYYRSTGKMPKWPGVYGLMPARLAAGLPAGSLDAAAKYFVGRKKGSIAYIAAGFIEIAKFFGRPMTTKVSSKGLAALSTGKKATPQDLVALLMNFSRGADKVPGIEGALQKALDSVTVEIRDHLAQKMAARAKTAGAVP